MDVIAQADSLFDNPGVLEYNHPYNSRAIFLNDIKTELGQAWHDACAYVLSTFEKRFVNVEDKLQNALAQAVTAWQADGKANPQTFLIKSFLWANGHEQAHKGRQRRIQNPRSLDVSFGDDEETTVADQTEDVNSVNARETAMRHERLAQISASLDCLSSIERQVIELRYGLDGTGPRTLAETAQATGKSIQGAKNIEIRAIEKMQEEIIS